MKSEHWRVLSMRVSNADAFHYRYWETREQRTPTLKGKLVQKADQEQQDPLEYLQSDEEDDEKSGAQRRLQEQRERLHGALALIELANLTGAPLRQ